MMEVSEVSLQGSDGKQTVYLKTEGEVAMIELDLDVYLLLIPLI